MFRLRLTDWFLALSLASSHLFVVKNVKNLMTCFPAVDASLIVCLCVRVSVCVAVGNLVRLEKPL